jgi:hypothetical protein
VSGSADYLELVKEETHKLPILIGDNEERRDSG